MTSFDPKIEGHPELTGTFLSTENDSHSASYLLKQIQYFDFALFTEFKLESIIVVEQKYLLTYNDEESLGLSASLSASPLVSSALLPVANKYRHSLLVVYSLISAGSYNMITIINGARNGLYFSIKANLEYEIEVYKFRHNKLHGAYLCYLSLGPVAEVYPIHKLLAQGHYIDGSREGLFTYANHSDRKYYIENREVFNMIDSS